MSYLFCAFVYDRKVFDPRVLVEVLKEHYKPGSKDDAFVKVPVKGTIDALKVTCFSTHGERRASIVDVRIRG